MDSDIDHPYPMYLRSQLTILGHKLRSCLFFRLSKVCESYRLRMLESILVRNTTRTGVKASPNNKIRLSVSPCPR